MKTPLKTHLRIIWAIASKDLADALKNKNVLGVLLPAIFIIMLYRYLPIINASDRPPRLRLLDQGNPASLDKLEDSDAFRLSTYDTLDDLQYALTNEELPEAALVLPAGFDTSVEKGTPLEIQGYMLHFFRESEVLDTKRLLESEFEALFGGQVNIRIDRIELQEESFGITVLTSLALTFVTVMMGMVALPNIMLEEKDSRTLDVILVSPAGGTHIVVAKAITGVVYSLAVFGFAIFLYRMYIVHWWLIVLGGLLGGALAVSIGLALGILVDNRQQLVLWGWVILVPLFIPMVLVVLDDLVPSALISGLRWIPTVSLMRLLRTSMVGQISLPYFLPQIFVLLGGIILMAYINVRLIRRLDR